MLRRVAGRGIADTTSRIAPAVLAAARDAGMFRLVAPCEVDGWELSLPELFAVMSELAFFAVPTADTIVEPTWREAGQRVAAVGSFGAGVQSSLGVGVSGGKPLSSASAALPSSDVGFPQLTGAVLWGLSPQIGPGKLWSDTAFFRRSAFQVSPTTSCSPPPCLPTPSAAYSAI